MVQARDASPRCDVSGRWFHEVLDRKFLWHGVERFGRLVEDDSVGPGASRSRRNARRPLEPAQRRGLRHVLQPVVLRLQPGGIPCFPPARTGPDERSSVLRGPRRTLADCAPGAGDQWSNDALRVGEAEPGALEERVCPGGAELEIFAGLRTITGPLQQRDDDGVKLAPRRLDDALRHQCLVAA